MARLIHNPLKPKIEKQGWVLGTFVEIPAPQVVEILGLAGFDFAVIDCEHGSLSPERVDDMIRAASSTAITPIVRVPQCDPVAVRLPLDAGAAGIHVPQIETTEMAKAAAQYARFHPQGSRGMHPYVRSASYRAFPTSEYLSAANQEVAVVVHVEGAGGLRDLDAILEVPGIDVVFLGPYDLSQALGVPGQVNDPRIEAAIRDAVARCPADRVIGTYADSPEGVRKWRDAGVRYLTMNIDAGMLLASASKLSADAKT